MTENRHSFTDDHTAEDHARAEQQALRDIAEVPAVEVISSAAIHLMSCLLYTSDAADDSPPV